MVDSYNAVHKDVATQIEIDTTGLYSELRRGVQQLCARFGGEYWRKLDGERGYPVAFVEAMTAAGFLGVLIPEEYGGGARLLRRLRLFWRR